MTDETNETHEELQEKLPKKSMPWRCPHCNNTHKKSGKVNERPLFRDVIISDILADRTCYLCDKVTQVSGKFIFTNVSLQENQT